MSFFRTLDHKNDHQGRQLFLQPQPVPDIYQKKYYASTEEMTLSTKGYHIYYVGTDSFYLESIQGHYRYDCGTIPIGILFQTKILSNEKNQSDRSIRKKNISTLCHESPKAAEAAASALAINNDAKEILILSKIYPDILPIATTSAAYGNHTPLMNQLIQKGGGVDDALKGAVMSKNFVLCKELIHRGAKTEILKAMDPKFYQQLELSIDIMKQVKEYFLSTGFLTIGRDHRATEFLQTCVSAQTEKGIVSILEYLKASMLKEKKDDAFHILLIQILRQIKGKNKLPFLMADHDRVGKQSPAYGSFFHHELFDKNTLSLIFDFAEDNTKNIEEKPTRNKPK